LAALVDSATVPRDVTITSDEPDGTITPRPAVTVPASGGAQSSFRYGMYVAEHLRGCGPETVQTTMTPLSCQERLSRVTLATSPGYGRAVL
jgi:hypothetical protein